MQTKKKSPLKAVITQQKHFAHWEIDPPIYLNVQEPRIHFMLKDLYWIFCYWHWGQDPVNSFNKSYGQKAWHHSLPAIRCYELDNDYSFDIPINNDADTWYLPVNNQNTLVTLYLGRILEGRFIHLASSNTLKIPLGRLSPRIDPDWQPISSFLPSSAVADVPLGGLSSSK